MSRTTKPMPSTVLYCTIVEVTVQCTVHCKNDGNEGDDVDDMLTTRTTTNMATGTTTTMMATTIYTVTTAQWCCDN